MVYWRSADEMDRYRKGIESRPKNGRNASVREVVSSLENSSRALEEKPSLLASVISLPVQEVEVSKIWKVRYLKYGRLQPGIKPDWVASVRLKYLGW